MKIQLGVIIFCLLISTSFANEDITIESESMDVKRELGQIIFLKDTVVKKGSDRLISNKVIVYYDEEKLNDKLENSLKRVEAIGNVKIFSDKFTATGDIAVYNPKTRLIRLKKNVILYNEKSLARGDNLIYNVDTQKVRLLPSRKTHESNRVTIIINE